MEIVGSLLAMMAFIAFVLLMLALGAWLGLVALWLVVMAVVVSICAGVLVGTGVGVVWVVAKVERWRERMVAGEKIA